jgi:hypothetical protein
MFFLSKVEGYINKYVNNNLISREIRNKNTLVCTFSPPITFSRLSSAKYLLRVWHRSDRRARGWGLHAKRLSTLSIKINWVNVVCGERIERARASAVLLKKNNNLLPVRRRHRQPRTHALCAQNPHKLFKGFFRPLTLSSAAAQFQRHRFISSESEWPFFHLGARAMTQTLTHGYDILAKLKAIHQSQ